MTGSLFPLHIKSISKSGENTADLKEIARTLDGHEFAIRWPEDGHGIVASEWLGYKLAQSVQIATPFATALVETHTGRLAFGSRWESAAVQMKMMAIAERTRVLEQCGEAMTAVLTLDIFCGNVDRHGNNWLFTKNREGEFTPLCIDFSKALFTRNFPNDTFPMGPCHTTTTQSVLKRANFWSNPTAVFTLGQIQDISEAHLERWLEDVPVDWIDEKTRQTLLGWWGSEAYHIRLQKCYDLI